jgi:hypothetical protein
MQANYKFDRGVDVVSFYIFRVLIALTMCFYSINTWSAWGPFLQEDVKLEGHWSSVNSSTTLTPGVAQTKNSSGVLKVRFYPTADFVGYRLDGGEKTYCIRGCSNFYQYYTAGIQWDQWYKGAALGVPDKIFLTNENGGHGVFSPVGSTVIRDSNTVITDSSSSPIADFGDGVAVHRSPWIDSFNLPYDVPYIFHGRNGESYTFSMPLSVPVGTEAGTYRGGVSTSINYQYCGAGCSPDFRSGTMWINDNNFSISVVIPSVCKFSDSSLTIDYKSLSPREVQGKVAPPASTTLSCNSSVSSGTLKLTSTSGSNWSSSVGTSVKVKDKLDAILQVNGKDASNGMPIPIGSQGNAVKLDITSTLNANGNHPKPGPFSGNAILVFSPN